MEKFLPQHVVECRKDIFLKASIHNNSSGIIRYFKAVNVIKSN